VSLQRSNDADVKDPSPSQNHALIHHQKQVLDHYEHVIQDECNLPNTKWLPFAQANDSNIYVGHLPINDRNHLKEGSLFWLTVSKVSVHGHLAPLFLDLWGERQTKRVRERDRERPKEKKRGRERKRKKWQGEEESGDKICPSKAHPQ
jgi:hypothetical protein